MQPDHHTPDEDTSAAREAIRAGNGLEAIRLYRRATGCGVNESKEWMHAERDRLAAATTPLTFTYRNYRGEMGQRRVMPISVRFGSTEWHPEPQWLLRAHDFDKEAEREFAMQDIGAAERPASDGWAAARAVAERFVPADTDPARIGVIRQSFVEIADAAVKAYVSAVGVSVEGSQPSVEGEMPTVAPASDGWRPIATAPKDGSWILASNGQHVQKVRFKDPDDGTIWFDGAEPTHWRPLPALPSAERATGTGASAEVKRLREALNDAEDMLLFIQTYEPVVVDDAEEKTNGSLARIRAALSGSAES